MCTQRYNIYIENITFFLFRKYVYMYEYTPYRIINLYKINMDKLLLQIWLKSPEHGLGINMGKI